jgi:predicted FMN-binding regulatory protein PaiB
MCQALFGSASSVTELPGPTQAESAVPFRLSGHPHQPPNPAYPHTRTGSGTLVVFQSFASYILWFRFKLKNMNLF